LCKLGEPHVDWLGDVSLFHVGHLRGDQGYDLKQES